MLGHVTTEQEKLIDADIENSIDPSLSIMDVETLTNLGILKGIGLVKKYNPDMRDKKDDEIKKFIMDNLKTVVGVNRFETYEE